MKTGEGEESPSVASSSARERGKREGERERERERERGKKTSLRVWQNASQKRGLFFGEKAPPFGWISDL